MDNGLNLSVQPWLHLRTLKTRTSRNCKINSKRHKNTPQVTDRPLYMFVVIFNNRELKHARFETRTATGRENFVCQDSGGPNIFVLIISNGEKIHSNVNVVVWKQVKRENKSLPVAVRVSKTSVLKLSNYSPKANWLSVNIHRDEVEVNIHRWGE